MIWQYNDSTEQMPEEVAKSFQLSIHGLGFGRHGVCPFCTEKLDVLPQNKKPRKRSITSPGNRKKAPEPLLDFLTVEVCPVCGWWHVLRRHETSSHVNAEVQTFFARIGTVSGVLKEFDAADISVPTETLINYLVVKYPTRFHIPPRKLEEIVGAIFRDAGYTVRLTSYSADGGIDVIILDGPEGKPVGIEVKRWRGKIKVQQIRALAGALLEKGMPRGIFVTTGSFTKGAQKAAKTFFERGYPIELVNGDSLYDCLRLHRRAKYKHALDPTAPFYRFVENPQSVALDESNREEAEARLRQDLMQGLLNWIPRDHAAEGERMVGELWKNLWK